MRYGLRIRRAKCNLCLIAEPVSDQGEDVALLMFTPTTSAPKIVPLTHRNVVASVHKYFLGMTYPHRHDVIVMRCSMVTG